MHSGCWNNDKYHGKGKLYSLSNKTLTIGEWMDGTPAPNGKSTIYQADESDLVIRYARTEELKNGKIWRNVTYRGPNCGQGMVYKNGIVGCATYDNTGNCSHQSPPHNSNGCGTIDIPGESLNLSPGYLYL